jgi:hypothetical protein
MLQTSMLLSYFKPLATSGAREGRKGGREGRKKRKVKEGSGRTDGRMDGRTEGRKAEQKESEGRKVKEGRDGRKEGTYALIALQTLGNLGG